MVGKLESGRFHQAEKQEAISMGAYLDHEDYGFYANWDREREEEVISLELRKWEL